MSWFDRAVGSLGSSTVQQSYGFMPPSAWKEVPTSQNPIVCYSDFCSAACTMLSKLVEGGNQQLLREHAISMMEALLGAQEQVAVNTSDLIRFLITILYAVIPTQIKFRDCSPGSIKINGTLKRLFEMILRLWRWCFLLPTNNAGGDDVDDQKMNVNPTMLSLLFETDKRAVWYLFCSIDQYLSTYKVVNSNSGESWDDASFAIRYCNVDPVELALVHEIIQTVEWICIAKEKQMVDVFSASERCCMMLILRGLPAMETPAIIKGYLIFNEVSTLIPISIAWHMSTWTCFMVDEEPLVTWDLSIAPKLMATSNFDRILSQIHHAARLNTRLEYDYLISPFYRKLLQLTLNCDVNYFLRDLSLLPRVEVSTCVDDTLHLLEVYCLIFKYWSTRDFAYGPTQVMKFMEMLCGAWRKYSFELIIESLEDNSIVMCDALESILSIFTYAQKEKEASLLLVTVDCKQVYFRHLLLGIWHAVSKAGSRKHHTSQTTVLRCINCICNTLQTMLINQPQQHQDIPREQFLQYVLKMIQPDAIKIKKKYDVAGIIRDTLWILSHVHPSLELQRDQVKASFRTLLVNSLLGNETKDSVSYKFFESILQYLDTNEDVERSDMEMVKLVTSNGNGGISIVTPTNPDPATTITKFTTITTSSSSSSTKKAPKLCLSRVSKNNNCRESEEDESEMMHSRLVMGMNDEVEERRTSSSQKIVSFVRGTPARSSFPVGTSSSSSSSIPIKEEIPSDEDDEDSEGMTEDVDEVKIVSRQVKKRKLSANTLNLISPETDGLQEASSSTRGVKQRRTQSHPSPVPAPSLEVRRALLVEQLMDNNPTVIEAGLAIAVEMCNTQEDITVLVSSTALSKALRVLLQTLEEQAVVEDSLLAKLLSLMMRLVKVDPSLVTVWWKYEVIPLLLNRHVKSLLVGSKGGALFVEFVLVILDDDNRLATLRLVKDKLSSCVEETVDYFRKMLSVTEITASELENNVKVFSEWMQEVDRLEDGNDLFRQLNMEAILLQCVNDTTSVLHQNITTNLNTLHMLCAALSRLSTGAK